MERGQSPKLILLVEDNRGDVRLIQEALKETTVAHQMVALKNGIEAMSYLRREGEYAGAQRPDLIMLDLNLPKKDGREVLAEIKTDPKLKRIPVVVLTTSKNQEDVCRSYDLHVNAYITKSGRLDRVFNVVKMIAEFWLEIVTLPSE
ncbi:response regulator [Phormidium sp. CCY1219]|uniref:response regulator n=1 Tax=Phormidium sp. CCY1219 TaxID=2886104 RepID=UPI002D1E5FA2|nr:response regulator [Phormidium sp. CCY1219]MEB3826399.1 response regulator [Phormidium sp. CCY1219]